jgi:RNA polymerase sigma-70 factor (ECF subfamily)
VDAARALMLLHDARRATGLDASGDLVMLADQDRVRWDRAEIDEGRDLVLQVLRREPPGTFALEAAIAAVHTEAATPEQTDLRQILGLYDQRYAQHPSPVGAEPGGRAVNDGRPGGSADGGGWAATDAGRRPPQCRICRI